MSIGGWSRAAVAGLGAGLVAAAALLRGAANKSTAPNTSPLQPAATSSSTTPAATSSASSS